MMYRILFLTLTFIAMHACMSDSNNAIVQDRSTDTIIHKKTVVVYETETIQAPHTHVAEHEAIHAYPGNPQKINPTAPAQVQTEKADTQYLFYTNKKLSVKISPWVDGRRSIQLYSPDGNITYTFHDVRLSYSSVTELKFYTNGAVEKAISHNNPGASRYWTLTETFLSTANIPLTQVTTQYPIESINDTPKKMYWDLTKQEWVSKLVVECQPVPKGGIYPQPKKR